jgi:hypothetical protein
MTTTTAVRARTFLSWCREDLALKLDLLGRLEPNLKILSGIDFSWWEDSQLNVGETWRRQILNRLSDCDYGLLLLSPAFFASDFIKTVELPHFVGTTATKGALPVLLRAVPLDGSRTLHGVETTQVFTLNGKSYAELQGADRDDFAVKLASSIARRILGGGWRSL